MKARRKDGFTADALAVARLARQQARDAQDDGRRLRKRAGHVIREADCPEGTTLDRIPDDRVRDPHFELLRMEASEPLYRQLARQDRRSTPYTLGVRLMGDDVPWDSTITNYDPKNGVCPCCRDRPPRRTLCLVCNASAEFPVRWPMRERKATRKRALAGGTGKARKASSGAA